MNRNIWQGKYRQIRGEVKREWGKFTNNDRHRLEGEVDRVLGMVQQRYGYTRERAADEIEHYVGRYGKRAKATVSETVDQWRGRQSSSFPWNLVAIGLIGIVAYLSRFWWSQFTSTQTAAQQKTAREERRRARERDDVDERSWESFPASDPPASW